MLIEIYYFALLLLLFVMGMMTYKFVIISSVIGTVACVIVGLIICCVIMANIHNKA